MIIKSLNNESPEVISVFDLVGGGGVHVNHVLGKAGDVLIGGHVEFLLDFIAVIYNAHREVVRVGPLPPDHRYVLVIVLYFLYFVQDSVLRPLYMREELLDERQLQNRYLVVILLNVRVVVRVPGRAQELVLLAVCRFLALLVRLAAVFDEVEMTGRTQGLLTISF